MKKNFHWFWRRLNCYNFRQQKYPCFAWCKNIFGEKEFKAGEVEVLCFEMKPTGSFCDSILNQRSKLTASFCF